MAPMLALLLAIMTPIGSGRGVHRDQVLDLAFPHVHLVSGMLNPQTSSRSPTSSPQRPQGTTLGAGAGVFESGLSVGPTPTPPMGRQDLPSQPPGGKWTSSARVPLGAEADPPPDPPPIVKHGTFTIELEST